MCLTNIIIYAKRINSGLNELALRSQSVVTLRQTDRTSEYFAYVATLIGYKSVANLCINATRLFTRARF